MTAAWERRTVRVRRNVWAVKSPAPATDVANAITVADKARAVAQRAGKSVGDVYVSSVGDETHVWFEESGDHPTREGGEPE